MSEVISSQYEAEQFISEDENKQLTRDIHDYYVSLIVKNTGIHQSYVDQPLRYVKFIEVSHIVKQCKVDYVLFINAQFEGLAWTNSYPEPEQLVSEKYRERLNKYMYSSKSKEDINKLSKEVNKDLTNVLKNIRNGKNRKK